MIRRALWLIAALLVGCASPHSPSAISEAPPLSQRSWQQLQTALRAVPQDLNLALTQTAEARLQDAAPPPENAEPPAPALLLFDLLSHTRNPILLPDAQFEKLRNIAAGENRASPLPYASALTGYLTQADFACRQPLYAAYFQHRYDASNSITPCNSAVPFSVNNRYDSAKPLWLNSKRVSAIHLLFASKSESLASRFGHVALRLVVCPNEQSSADECDSNLAEHVVLGFRAHIDEFSLDTLKALSGNYKAYLFANPFMDVYEEYAIGEFREVYSLPLRLDAIQRESMVRALADIHWRYAGQYSFFTHNCATMLQDALRVAWPEFAASKNLQDDFLRPDSLFEAIKASSLAQGDALFSLEEAERKGYFFSNTKQFYDLALSEVSAGMKSPAFIDMKSYLLIPPKDRQLARETDKPFLARLAAEPHLREAQIMLEEYAVLYSARMMMIEAAKYVEQQDFLARADVVLAKLDKRHAEVFNDCLLTPVKQQMKPLKRLGGIPDVSESLDAAVPLSSCQSPESKLLLREAIGEIDHAQSPQWQRLNTVSSYWSQSIENLNSLKSMQ